MVQIIPFPLFESNFNLVQGAKELDKRWTKGKDWQNLGPVVLGSACLCRPRDLTDYRAVSIVVINKTFSAKYRIRGYLDEDALVKFLKSPKRDILDIIKLCRNTALFEACSYQFCIEYEPNPLPLPESFVFKINYVLSSLDPPFYCDDDAPDPAMLAVELI